MGCGISTLDIEDASLSQRSNKACQHAIAEPIIENKKDFENCDEGDACLLLGNHNNNNNKDVFMVMKPLLGDEESKTMKEDGSNGERLKEKSIVERKKEEEMVFESGGKEKHNDNDKYAKNIKNIEEKHEDQDDSFINGPRSPSFREYCNDYYDSRDQSSEDSNDCDSRESIKNGSGDDSSNMKNKPKNEESVYSNKEPEKKERRGAGFRNVINKGKTKRKRNFLNFACYNASSESYAEGSFNKIVEKTT